LIMGPFGATVILIFAMTSMSPSQPRSTIGGALCGMIIGKVISYSSLYGVPLGVRMALATSLTAAVMAKMCIIYPPGGALALIFSSQLLGWDKVILQLFGTILTLSLGVIINNLHPLRCYPAYWL
ncbi:HPP family protein, partial [Fragilariopsis cylindrus CCMP1102]